MLIHDRQYRFADECGKPSISSILEEHIHIRRQVMSNIVFCRMVQTRSSHVLTRYVEGWLATVIRGTTGVV